MERNSEVQAIGGGAPSNYEFVVELYRVMDTLPDGRVATDHSYNGIVIGPHHVLTHAHMITNENTYMVNQGVNTVNRFSKRVSIDPEYIPGEPAHDFAIITTEGESFPETMIARLNVFTLPSIPNVSNQFECDQQLVGYNSELKQTAVPVCLVAADFFASHEYFSPLKDFLLKSKAIDLGGSPSSGLYNNDIKIVPENSAFVRGVQSVEASVVPGGFCIGSSGAALVDGEGRVSAIFAAIVEAFAGIEQVLPCQMPDASYHLGIVAPLVNALNFINTEIRTEVCGADRDNDQWGVRDGKCAPTCGNLGREFGYRLLDLPSNDDWDESHAWRLNCISTEQAITQYEDASRDWARLDRVEPFALSPSDPNATFTSPYAVTADCGACFLRYGFVPESP